MVLRQLSSDTADRVAKTVEESLKRPHISVLLGVPQARMEPPDPEFIAPVLTDSCTESPFIDEYYMWSAAPSANGLGGRWLVFDRASGARSGPALGRFHEDTEVRDRLLPQVPADVLAARGPSSRSPTTFTAGTHYIQAQLRWASPARDRLTEPDGLRGGRGAAPSGVLPHAGRRAGLAAAAADRLPSAARDAHRRPRTHRRGGHGEGEQSVDERTFPLVFFDKELLEFAAPYEAHRETWRLHTSYGPATIPAIVSANTRPQLTLMLLVAAVMGVGVFLMAGAAAREVRLAELKSNFVASVSHDLKTPLALIQLFAETLELGRARSTDRAQEYYRIINGEAKKLTRLIENILDFSRMEAGLRPYTLAPADIGRAGAPRGHLDGAAVRTSAVRRAVPGRAGPAERGSRCRSPWNGRWRTSSPTRRSTRATRAPSKSTSTLNPARWSCGCATTASALPRREQRRIFRKFFASTRSSAAARRAPASGLAIVDHTMRGHGGYVGVESEPGQGSTFTLHFPAARAGGV